MRFDIDMIKSRLSCAELLAMHGIKANQKGMARCCFHDDTHPSMAVFDDHVHCYACGAHEDVIGLAKQLYSVSIAEAIKITAGLAGIAAIDNTWEYKRKVDAIRQKADERKQTINALNESYYKLLAEFARLERNKTEYAPGSPNTDLHPLFVEAITRIEFVWYAMIECERMILDAEKARRDK